MLNTYRGSSSSCLRGPSATAWHLNKGENRKWTLLTRDFFQLLLISKFINNLTSGLTQPNRVISSGRVAKCLEFILKVILFFRLSTIRLVSGVSYHKLTTDRSRNASLSCDVHTNTLAYFVPGVTPFILH